MTATTNKLMVLSLMAVLNWTACSSQFSAVTKAEGNEKGMAPERVDRFEAITLARTARAIRARIIDFAEWVLRSEERIGIENCEQISRAIHSNRFVRNASAIDDYFFRLTDVFPDDCTSEAHSRIERRIREQQMVARSCDKAGLVKALQERRDFLGRTQSFLDDNGACLKVP